MNKKIKETMEANGLMIGDYFYRPDCVDRVVEIHKNGVIGSDPLRGLIPWSEIKPISLTIEILERNGFVKLGGQYDIWIGRGFNFALDLVDGVFGYHEQGHPYSPTFITIYVHELQHALRLFGLNEIADNLKI